MAQNSTQLFKEMARFEEEVLGIPQAPPQPITEKPTPLFPSSVVSAEPKPLLPPPPPPSAQIPPPAQIPPQAQIPPPPPLMVPHQVPHIHHHMPHQSMMAPPPPPPMQAQLPLVPPVTQVPPQMVPQTTPQAATNKTTTTTTAMKKKKKNSLKNQPKSAQERAAEAVAISIGIKTKKFRRQSKDVSKLRVAGGEVWEDPTLKEWDSNDYRIFCGDLGNDVNDDTLAKAFSKYSSFQRARVIRDKFTKKTKGFGFVSFKDPHDFMLAMREMNGKYVGSRPIKLKKSTWKDRQYVDVKKKDKEKKKLGLKY